MHSGGGTYRHGRMYPPPRGGEFGRGDGYGHYGGGGCGVHIIQGHGGGMGMGCAAYRAGIGVGAKQSSVFYDHFFGTYGSGGGSYDNLPLGRGATLWKIWRLKRHGGAGRGLGIGLSNGGAAPGCAFGVGGFNFDNGSPRFHTEPGILRGDSLYSLPSAGSGGGTIGSGAGGRPDGSGFRRV
jgi:hypothetical protein